MFFVCGKRIEHGLHAYLFGTQTRFRFCIQTTLDARALAPPTIHHTLVDDDTVVMVVTLLARTRKIVVVKAIHAMTTDFVYAITRPTATFQLGSQRWVFK